MMFRIDAGQSHGRQPVDRGLAPAARNMLRASVRRAAPSDEESSAAPRPAR